MKLIEKLVFSINLFLWTFYLSYQLEHITAWDFFSQNLYQIPDLEKNRLYVLVGKIIWEAQNVISIILTQ